MHIQPSDIAVFLVSIAACLYCFVLSRRLSKLQNTKDGLGATITALSHSIQAMSTTTQDSRARVGELAMRLSQLITEAEAASQRLQAAILEADAANTRTTENAKAVQADISKTLHAMLGQSKERISEMLTLMYEVRAAAEAAPATRAPAKPALVSTVSPRPQQK